MTLCLCIVYVCFNEAAVATRWLPGSCLCAIHREKLVAGRCLAPVGTPSIASASDCIGACMVCIKPVHRRDGLLLLHVSDFLF